jgi:cellulose synthase/poly-beta-1,6-N-acetylglucosamine synthase-like glycosyltransferase
MTGISVVMPVGSVLPELREQFMALSHQCIDAPWELVLSLNTPDASEALDESLVSFTGEANVVIVDSSGVRSASHARNVGAGNARFERIAFCDADDIADPGWLAALHHALDDHRAVGGFLEEARLAVPGQENWRPPATPGGNPTFLGHEFLVSANMAVWTTDFLEVGGFDESLLRGEDIAFSWELLRRGATLGYAPDAIMHYRHREGLWPMMKQHYLYGRGMSQILARRGTPDGNRPTLRANGQSVDKMSTVHALRRGSIAVGRMVGLLQERLPSRRVTEPDG